MLRKFLPALLGVVVLTAAGPAISDTILKLPIYPKALDLSRYPYRELADIEGIHLGDSTTEAYAALQDAGYVPLEDSQVRKRVALRMRKYRRNYEFRGMNGLTEFTYYKVENSMRDEVRVWLTNPYRGSRVWQVERKIEWKWMDPEEAKRQPSFNAIKALLLDKYGPSDRFCWITQGGKLTGVSRRSEACVRPLELAVSAKINTTDRFDDPSGVGRVSLLEITMVSNDIGEEKEWAQSQASVLDAYLETLLEEERQRLEGQGAMPDL